MVLVFFFFLPLRHLAVCSPGPCVPLCLAEVLCLTETARNSEKLLALTTVNTAPMQARQANGVSSSPRPPHKGTKIHGSAPDVTNPDVPQAQYKAILS